MSLFNPLNKSVIDFYNSIPLWVNIAVDVKCLSGITLLLEKLKQKVLSK